MLIGVNYTLHGVKDYESLYKLLKSTGTWCRVLDSFWIVRTTESIDAWNRKLKSILDSDDSFMIHDMTEAFANGSVRAYLPLDVVEWLNRRIGQPAFAL